VLDENSPRAHGYFVSCIGPNWLMWTHLDRLGGGRIKRDRRDRSAKHHCEHRRVVREIGHGSKSDAVGQHNGLFEQFQHQHRANAQRVRRRQKSHKPPVHAIGIDEVNLAERASFLRR